MWQPSGWGSDAITRLIIKKAEIGLTDVWINVICLIPSLLVAVLVYFILVIKLGALNKRELRAMPKGYLLLSIAEKMHLVHT